jgi:hypothetical protein
MLKNITLSADDILIEEARQKAQKQKKTLNTLFREWLLQYLQREKGTHDYHKLMQRLKHVRSGGPYSRESLNERR